MTTTRSVNDEPDDATPPVQPANDGTVRYQYAPMTDAPPGWWFVQSDGTRWQSLGARPVYVREDDPYRDPNIAREIDGWDQVSRPADGSCGERTIRTDGARTWMVWIEVPEPASARPRQLVKRNIDLSYALDLLHHALSQMTATVHGPAYDWNADPKALTKLCGDAFALYKEVSTQAVTASPPSTAAAVSAPEGEEALLPVDDPQGAYERALRAWISARTCIRVLRSCATMEQVQATLGAYDQRNHARAAAPPPPPEGNDAHRTWSERGWRVDLFPDGAVVVARNADGTVVEHFANPIALAKLAYRDASPQADAAAHPPSASPQSAPEGDDALRLCYVRDSFAWFTAAPIDQQWGDDWDDAPYEHNAGSPYPDRYVNERSVPHRIVRVAWEGCYVPPCDGFLNSPWSVKQINSGAVAWLRPEKWGAPDAKSIPAGLTLADFIAEITRCGGTVYLPTAVETAAKGKA